VLRRAISRTERESPLARWCQPAWYRWVSIDDTVSKADYPRTRTRNGISGFLIEKKGLITLSFEDKLESTLDALWHIKELMNALKQLGVNYINHVDVLDDIRRQLEIDESVTEQKLNEQWDREQRALIREYYQMI